jgi:LPXTG-motif cell wall-anchored protein
MKKSMMLALLGLMFMGGTKAFAQDDSATIAEEPKDTISIDNMDPVYYEEEETKESSNAMTYAIVGGIVVIGGAAYFFMKKKK